MLVSHQRSIQHRPIYDKQICLPISLRPLMDGVVLRLIQVRHGAQFWGFMALAAQSIVHSTWVELQELLLLIFIE